MNLKKKEVNKPSTTNRYEEVKKDIKILMDRKKEIEAELDEKYLEKIQLEFSPFKHGDHVIMEIQQGKSRKESECILEFEKYTFQSLGYSAYVRPIKADGTPSGRHFGVYDVKHLKKA